MVWECCYLQGKMSVVGKEALQYMLSLDSLVRQLDCNKTLMQDTAWEQCCQIPGNTLLAGKELQLSFLICRSMFQQGMV